MSEDINPFISLGQAFKEELKTVVAQVLMRNGVKSNSNLIDSIEFDANNRSQSLFMVVNDYYRNVSEGRKPRARKVPIYSLIEFIKRNNIRSTKYSVNQLAFAMQNAIYKSGLKGKNFIEEVENTVLDIVEIRVSETLEEELADALFTSFKIK